MNATYGLREGLAILAEEGLEKAWKRHKQATEQLYEGTEYINIYKYEIFEILRKRSNSVFYQNNP